MSWFRVVAGRLQYQGRITRAPFTKWTTTKEGASVVARVAGGIRFSLFGRAGAARRRIWRALDGAVRTDSVSAAMTAEAQRYMQALARLWYSDALPRVHIALHRLVLLPRAMVTAHVRVELCKRLSDTPGLRGLDEEVRNFFLDQAIVEMNAALQKGGPSPKHPVQAHDEWACVGVSRGLVWVDPIWAGVDGTGHVFMYEFPRPGMPRPKPRELTVAIGEMSAGVASLSRLQRFALVRAAVAR